MIIESVNVGQPRPIAAKSGLSGIFKAPQSEPVFASRDGLNGDSIIDVQHHGGTEQAVYVYTRPDLDWWRGELNDSIVSGTFGENVLISEGESSEFCIGDQLHVNGVVLEVNSHRTPCSTLSARMNDPAFAKKFWRAGRLGFYCRILAEGQVSAGDLVTIVPFEGPKVTVREYAAASSARELTREFVQRMLATPVHLASRAMYQQLLEQAQTS